jgi:hypothetical protein
VRRILLLLAAVAIAAVAGCAAPVTGTPAPASGGVEAGGVVLPPRPRELRLDGVDPCGLLTAEQRAELGLDGDSLPGTTDAPYFAGRKCSLVGFEPRDIALSFTLATSSGLNQLLAPGVLRGTTDPTAVAGFPAVIARPTLIDVCAVAIDVAEGQFLDIQFRDAGNRPPIPQDQLCRDAVQVAEAAMQTMQGG